jgi:hypothetical protein
MVSLHAVNLLWCLHCFASAPFAGTARDAGARVIPFDADHNGAVVVQVRIGGAGPFRFLVDTGSSHSAIAQPVAARLGLRAVAKAEIMSASGQLMRRVVSLDSIRVGQAERSVLASVLEPADLRAVGPDVDGVLGQDFLSVFDYTLDYERGELRWDEDDAAGGSASRLPMSADRGRFVVTLPQGAGRGSVRLVPDTGSASLVIFERANREGAGGLHLQHRSELVRMSGVAGDRLVSRAVVRDLRVGDLVFLNEPAVVVNADEGDGTDGLLPLHRFARVSFHARESCLLVWGR